MSLCPVPLIDLDKLNPATVKPTGTLVWVKLPRITDKTEGGIVLPEETVEPPSIGTIVSTGPKALNVEPGQVILFAKHSPGATYTHGNNKYKLVPESDIIGTVTVTI